MSSGKQLKVQARRAQLHDKESGLTQEHLQSVVSQQEIVLPDAEELAKYQKLDSTIVTWLMDHAAKEQDFRHQSHNRKLTIREKNAGADRRLNGWGMLCGFLIFMSGMALGAYLIHTGHGIAGSLFGGVTLLGGASLFVNRITDKPKPPSSALAVQETQEPGTEDANS
ncbi:MAG: hypothetical protein ACRYFK_07445 [Janthinobacterium lividum]